MISQPALWLITGAPKCGRQVAWLGSQRPGGGGAAPRHLSHFRGLLDATPVKAPKADGDA
jgi:hypothetical protein